MNAENMDVDKYLSKNERNIINNLDIRSNLASHEQKKSREFLNLSLKKLFQNWALNMNQIIKELTHFIANSRKFSTYFNDIDDTNRWFIGLKNFFSELIYIFIKNNRSIYFGLSLILFGFLIHIIQISS